MRWVRRIAVAGIVWCAALLAASALLEGIPPPTPIAAAGLLPALPAFVVTLFAARRLERRETGKARGSASWAWRLVREAMPGWALIASLLLFVGFWVVGATSGPSVQELGAGTYAAQKHGRWTVISKAQYLRLKAQNQRLLVSVPGGFCVFAAVVSTALLRREARHEAVRPPS